MKKTVSILSLASLLLCAASASAAVTQKSDCADEAHYPMINKAQLKTVAEKKQAFIVDVNSDESFAKAHVPGAIHFGSHEKDFVSLLPKDKSALVVAYCGGPQCNAWKKAAEEACKAGYTHVQHFKEGISGWTSTSN
jgi:rhodanese-related sulfurtransferase